MLTELLDAMTGSTWQLDAACRDADPELFYPPTPERAADVIGAYCEQCPVVHECDQAGQDGNEFGIWGGRYRRGWIGSPWTRADILAGAGYPGVRTNARGVCGSCGVIRRVRADGTVGSHPSPGSGGRVPCPGVGTRPKAAS